MTPEERAKLEKKVKVEIEKHFADLTPEQRTALFNGMQGSKLEGSLVAEGMKGDVAAIVGRLFAYKLNLISK